MPWVTALQLDGRSAEIVPPAITEVVSLDLQNWNPNKIDKINMRKEASRLLYELNELEADDSY